MPTYYSDLCSITAGAIKPAKTGQETITAVGTFTVTANLAANDIIQMVKIPKGAIIHDVKTTTSASLASTSTAEVGDGSDTDRFIASGTFGQGAASASQTMAPTGIGYAYPADDTIDIKINTQTTPVTGAVIKTVVQYHVP